MHRRTVRQALASAVPPARKPPRRSSPVLDAVRDLIDSMLREDLAAPVKQRHTCRRIFQRLVDEHDVQISYSSVVNYVGHRRPQIVAEARDRAGVVDGFVPQTHVPGRDAEVDFGEAWVRPAPATVAGACRSDRRRCAAPPGAPPRREHEGRSF